jgi:ribose 5-phosphate isomerase B
MKIAIGSDHAGYRLKALLKEEIEQLGFQVVDFGAESEAEPVDCYHSIGARVAEEVVSGGCRLGVVICGTGIGISLAANKVPGAYAALCNDLFTAKKSRQHNDANVLALGSRVIGEGLAKEIVRVWLGTPYEGGRHIPRNENLKKIEAKYWRKPNSS